MRSRDAFRVILAYIDHEGKWTKTSLNSTFETVYKSKQEALDEAVEMAAKYLCGEISFGTDFMNRTVKQVVGCYVEKFDYLADN